VSKVRFAPAAGTHRQRVHHAIGPVAGGAPPALAAASPSTPGEAVAARWLTGVAAFGDHDGARVVELIGDDSRRVRGIAITTAPLACDDAQATEALRIAWSLRGERRLLRRMSRFSRTAAIDAFLDGLAADGQLRDLIDDLPFGSEAAVRRHLVHALDRPSQRFWDGLAKGHPGVLAEVLHTRWSEVPGEADPVTRQLTSAHHGRMAERAPDGALALAELLLARGIEPAQVVWTELLRRRPSPTVELAIKFQARVPYGLFRRRARELAPELLARIIGHAPHLLGTFGPRVRTMSSDRQSALAHAWCHASERFPAEGTYLLRYLPADARRDAAYERWSIASRNADGVINAGFLGELPVDLAAREAARHVRDVVALQVDGLRRLGSVARYLPWDEVEVAVKDHLGHPDGAVRALALGELIANVAVYPDDTTLPARALELVLARKFEQDPVRSAIFGGLVRWPRRVWRPEHLPAIERAVRDALDAADLSVSTASLAEALIVRLFGVDPAWAARQLALLIKERGTLHDPNIGNKLSDADIVAAAPELVAIAKQWSTQERAPWLIAFARGLGPRMTLCTGLPELLVRVREATPHEWFASQISDLLARHDPERHAATLQATIARYRQRDWYGALFALAELHGLSGTQSARQRWRRRPTLPGELAEAIADIARERDQRYAPTALAVLRRRAPQTFDTVVAEVVRDDKSVAIVPDVSRWLHRHRQDLLTPYLGSTVIRGVWATGKTKWVLPFRDGFFRWTPAQCEQFSKTLAAVVNDHERDTPSVFSSLTIWPELEYVDLSGLFALARDLRPAVKEKAIRVLARCDAGQGVPALLECLADGRARFAIYGLRRALFNMLPDRALTLIKNVSMRKVTVAKELLRLSGELRAAGAFSWLEQLSTTQLHRDIRIALLRALWDHLDREPTWAIFERAVSDPDWVVASRLADIPADRLTAVLDDRLSHLLARVLGRREPEARIDLMRRAAYLRLLDPSRHLLSALHIRLRSPFDDEIRFAIHALLARSTESDLPALGHAFDGLRSDPRALHVAADALLALDIGWRASWHGAARQFEPAARRDARLAVLAIRAAASRRLAPDLIAAIETTPLDHDALTAAVAAIPTLRDDDLDGAAHALATSRIVGARRVAVAALGHSARASRGWTAARLALLAKLRADDAAEVAGAASRLWPPRELDPA